MKSEDGKPPERCWKEEEGESMSYQMLPSGLDRALQVVRLDGALKVLLVEGEMA